MRPDELEELARRSLDETDSDFGYYPGYRAGQAKGTLSRGKFTATGAAGPLTRAVHLQPGAVTPVTVRFSNAATNPMRRDGTLDVRSMAATFHLADGERTDILALRMSRFFVGTAQQFLRWQRAMRQCLVGDLPRPGRWFLVYIVRGLPKTFFVPQLRSLCRIPSYAASRYNSLHAFKWVKEAGGEEHWVRYSWVPEIPQERLRWWQWRWWRAPRRDPDYLRTELVERLERWPVRFRLEVQLAGRKDRVDDASAKWKKKGRRITVGTLELTETGAWASIGKDQLRFDPTRVIDGIELPEGDSLLMLRKHVYARSAERRLGKKKANEAGDVPNPAVNGGRRPTPDPAQKKPSNGIDICYDISGDQDGPPLLLIMGFACPMTWWTREFLYMLEEKGFRVIRFDNRDSGNSDRINAKVNKLMMFFPRKFAPYKVEDMANDAAGLLDQLNVPAAHVMGISLGGMVAQELAIKHPQKVLSLTSINATPRFRIWSRSRGPKKRVLLRLGRPFTPKRSEQKWVKFSLPLWRLLNGGRLPPVEEKNVRALLATQWSWSGGVDPKADLRQMLAVLGSSDRTPGLGGLELPALVIHGTDDPLIRFAGGEETRDAIEGATWLPIEGMGHYTPKETWAPIIDAVADLAAGS